VNGDHDVASAPPAPEDADADADAADE